MKGAAASVLVTGSAGYIGGFVARDLTRRGYPVAGLDVRRASPSPHVNCMVVDLRDSYATLRALKHVRPDVIVHAAGVKSVSESMADPALYYETNVQGTQNLMDAARSTGSVRRVIFSSSCSVYGPASASPVIESDATGPESPYAKSKLLAESIVEAASSEMAATFCTLRYFNVAGADFDGAHGEMVTPQSSQLIPRTLLAGLGRRPPVQVFGVDHPTPDGTALRDYVHVVDLARAHSMAVDSAESSVINLGTGQATSVRDILQLASDVLGTAVPHEQHERRIGETHASWADATRARERLSWVADHDIRAIIESAAAWHRAGRDEHET